MSQQNSTTEGTVVTINIHEMATVVGQAIAFYRGGRWSPDFPVIFAMWDTLTDLDPENQGDAESLMDGMERDVLAVLEGRATFNVVTGADQRGDASRFVEPATVLEFPGKGE